jgi:hypothetical protein
MTTQTISPVRSAAAALGAIFGAAAARIGAALDGAAAGARCARDAKRLLAMSDADLARRGLTRDRIAEHCFARHMR